ncbi:hypothetical protein KI387_006655, partial [Taxus chinensis]
MAIPTFHFLFLKDEAREMAFYRNISHSRLKNFFRIGSGSVCNAMEQILGESYLQGSDRGRLNAEIASVFVSNLLMIGKNKEETILIARHYSVGLEEVVSQLCMPSVFLRETDVVGEPELEIFAELEKRNYVLWEFPASLHKKCYLSVGAMGMHILQQPPYTE